MAYDGNQNSNRVDHFTERRLHARVVDQVLSYPTFISRLMRRGKPFLGKTEDITIDIARDQQGEWFSGVEPLNSSAADTTIQLSYAQAAFSQPKVSIMLESFANSGSAQTIPLDAFKYEKAAIETLTALATSVYADGTGGQPNGLGNIVADSGTIGGQSRSTYSQLNATVTASGGTLTLAKMATLDDALTSGSDMPTIGLTTKTVWSLYEQLLTPTVRAEYNSIGYPGVAVGGNSMVKRAELKGGMGFTALSYRGMPIIKDEYAPAGVLFFLNENYFEWRGRAIVPDEYKDILTKVNLGTSKAYEGTARDVINDLPSEWNGFFYQKPLMMPNQAGTIARFYVIGQFVGTGFRRSGKLTGITSV